MKEIDRIETNLNSFNQLHHLIYYTKRSNQKLFKNSLWGLKKKSINKEYCRNYYCANSLRLNCEKLFMTIEYGLLVILLRNKKRKLIHLCTLHGNSINANPFIWSVVCSRKKKLSYFMRRESTAELLLPLLKKTTLYNSDCSDFWTI